MDELEPVAWMRVIRGEITHLTHLATLGYEPLVRKSDANAIARERDAMRAEVDLWHAGKLTLMTMPDGRPCIMHHRDDPNAEIRDPDTGEVLFPAVKAPFRVIENEARLALNQEQPA